MGAKLRKFLSVARWLPWRHLLGAPVTVAAGFLLGFGVRALFWPGGEGEAKPTPGAGERPQAVKPAAPKVQMWTCAMHPQIRQPKPGRCPICGMELVPVKGSGGGSMRRFVTTEEAKALVRIETSPVERKLVTATVRVVGKVDYDETRLAYITAWVPGRIDRLYVDYTGITVHQGDHMVYLYSPDLYAAQEELLQALKAAGEMKGSSLELVRDRTRAMVGAAREKLRLLGLTPEQVAEVEKRGTPTDHVTIHAPVGGIVIHKNAQEGMYVQTGTRIYTIADLSQVWVKLDAYESDLMWLRYGQKVTFTTEAYPGEEFEGRIAFIDPILNPRTRTAKVRVNVANRRGKLKPDMFVRAVVRATVAAGGRVMEPDLAGKWICRMHPEVVKDTPGKCDKCGMPLERTESLGYLAVNEVEKAAPLVIPASAALITGRRAVVYVEVPKADKPTYEGREVVLGPRAGDYYIVRNGLAEGELVVTRGNFKIDSALQILAKPSMMTPEGGGGAPSAPGGRAQAMSVPASFLAHLRGLQGAHAEVKGALKTGDLDRIRKAYGRFAQALEAVGPGALSGHPRMVWNELAMLLKNSAVVGGSVPDVGEAAREVATLDGQMARLAKAFGLHKMPAHRPPSMKVPEAFQAQLAKVLEQYLALGAALARDDAAAARKAAGAATGALGGVDMKLLEGDAHMAWMRELPGLEKPLAEAAGAKDIHGEREAFALLSEQMAAVARMFRLAGQKPLYVLRCPMAFNNRGARWLQRDRQVRNPYFGAAMLQCGEVVGKVE